MNNMSYNNLHPVQANFPKYLYLYILQFKGTLRFMNLSYKGTSADFDSIVIKH